MHRNDRVDLWATEVKTKIVKWNELNAFYCFDNDFDKFLVSFNYLDK